MPQALAVEEIPCPRCEGWMGVAPDGHWRCATCGTTSEDPAADGASNGPASPGAIGPGPAGAAEDPVTFAQAAGPRPPVPWAPPRRRFALCLLYGVLSLGLYFAWYQYQVPREVDERSGQRHHAGLYVTAVGANVLGVVLDASVAGYDVLEVQAASAAATIAGTLLLALYWTLESRNLRTALGEVGSRRRPNLWALPLVALAGLLASFADQGALEVLGVAAAVFGVAAFFFYHDNVAAYWDAKARA